jgi:hypothetical protein
MVEESVNHPASAPNPSSTRCVVLTCPGGLTPVDLLGGLSKRGVSSRVVAQPAEVIVELASQSTGILVVVDPTQQPALVDLIEAVTSYFPRTVRWAYLSTHRSGKPQLQPLDGSAIGELHGPQNPPPTSHPKPSPPRPSDLPKPTPLDSPSPLGRVQSLVPPERVRSLIVKVHGPAEVGEPLISEEELAMLLGPVPEESGEAGGTEGSGGVGGHHE